MITEKELYDAIAECQGQRNPNANTCIKLAAYYTILDNVKQEKKPIQIGETGYSFKAPPEADNTAYTSESEFGELFPNLDQQGAMRVIDELMETIRIMHPRLYEATMRKLTVLEK